MNNKEPLNIGNYCVSFIDLLGQRLEYKNEDLVPEFKFPEEKEQFISKLRNTVGRIYVLQRASQSFLNAAVGYKSPLREELPSNLKPIYDELKKVRLKEQRWSDGLVYFISLMKSDVKCPINGLYFQLVATGSLCFIGLAGRSPLRGSIDIAWATELQEGELYGTAVVKAYELESHIAQYPRIVVGQRVVEFIIYNMNNTEPDIYGDFNRALGKACYEMLGQDVDGYYIVHYLGNVFRKYVTINQHKELYDESVKFIREQCQKWKDERNTKLSFRYNHLLSYFLTHPPSEPESGTTSS